MSSMQDGSIRLDLDDNPQHEFELFDNLDKARIPVKYLANLFSAGNEEVIRKILRKIYAVRIYMRRKTVEKNIDEATLQALTEAGTNPEEAEAIYKLTTLPTISRAFCPAALSS